MANPTRRSSVVFPVLLISLGVLFLLRSWRPEFNPWPIMWTYWPLLLIALGLAKIWDYSRPRQSVGGASMSSRGMKKWQK